MGKKKSWGPEKENLVRSRHIDKQNKMKIKDPLQELVQDPGLRHLTLNSRDSALGCRLHLSSEDNPVSTGARLWAARRHPGSGGGWVPHPHTLTLTLTHTHTCTLSPQRAFGGCHVPWWRWVRRTAPRESQTHWRKESVDSGWKGDRWRPAEPGQEGTATAQPPGLVHTTSGQWAQPSTELWGFDLTEVVTSGTGWVAGPTGWWGCEAGGTQGRSKSGNPLSSSSDNLLRNWHSSPPSASAICKNWMNCQASAVCSHQGPSSDPGSPTSLKRGLFPLWIRVRLVCPAAVTLTTGLMFTPGSWRPSITWTLIWKPGGGMSKKREKSSGTHPPPERVRNLRDHPHSWPLGTGITKALGRTL